MKKGKQTYLDRSKAIGGLTQAYRMTMKAAILASDKEDGGRDEEKFYDLKLKITRKVAELWELSPMMEQYLIQRWVEDKVKPKGEVKEEDLDSFGKWDSSDRSKLWELSPMMEQYLIQRWVEGKVKPKVELKEEDLESFGEGYSSDRSKATGQDLELEILFTGKEVSKLPEINSKLEMSETRVITKKETRKEHLYLDVTGLSYKDLSNAYQAITKCRKMLGLELKDVKRGAPESMDFTRALLAAISEERGFSRKEVAEMLDFKIYREDIPSGTYPLLQKYLKVGRPILRRLNKLDEYIHELTGIEIDTL